jgi:hypothetical protein
LLISTLPPWQKRHGARVSSIFTTPAPTLAAKVGKTQELPMALGNCQGGSVEIMNPPMKKGN